MKHRRIILASGALLLAALAVWLYWPQAATALRGVEPACTVGLSGSAATITIQGWSATDDCNKIVSGQPSFLGGPAAPGNVYLVTGAATAPVLCELDKQGRHLIVRDQGFLTLVGTGECELLQKL